MRRSVFLLLLLATTSMLHAQGAPGDELRTALADIDLKGDWKYHDLTTGIAEARRTGKPLMVVYRCVPCVMCRSLDGVVRRREDSRLAELMERFVCVRMVQAWDMDLTLFQADHNLSWSVFFLHPDRTLYGRYGHGRNADADISVEGFIQACEAALALHADHPKDRAALAGKIGPAPRWSVAQQIPMIAGNSRFRQVTTDPKGCVHCHHVEIGQVAALVAERGRFTDADLWRFPMPDTVGLTMDPKKRATVTQVKTGSAAERAGFKIGDEIRTFAGQPVISIADLQWVLEHQGERGSIPAQVDRGSRSVELSLKLEPGWRRSGDFAWRTIGWPLRHQLGGFTFDVLDDAARKQAGLSPDAIGFRIKKMPPDWVMNLNKSPRQAGMKEGDIMLAADALRGPITESRWLAYLAQEKKAGDPVTLRLLRAGRPVELQFTVGKFRGE